MPQQIKNKPFVGLCLVVGLLALAQLGFGQQARLKDLVALRGVRSNRLIGYGIVVGLAGSGDTEASQTSKQAVAQMLTRLGVQTSPEQLVAGSYAAVVVTAELPPFARNGDRIDVRISTSGDATSLAGGTLLLTPLRAGDEKIYVMAEGAVVSGQKAAEGGAKQGGGVTVARVPGGGVIEREFELTIAADNRVQLNLKKADFTTTTHITQAINNHFKGYYAQSVDAARVEVKIPPPYQADKVAFLAEMENLRVEVDHEAVVVVNERTGTVVMGHEVSVGPVTIAHGELSVAVAAPGEQAGAGQKQEAKQEALLPVEGTTVGALVASLNRLGVKPHDLIAILQAIHAAGALQGELVFL